MLHHKVEPGYDTIVRPSEGAKIGVRRSIGQRATTQMRMIPHLRKISHKCIK